MLSLETSLRPPGRTTPPPFLSRLSLGTFFLALSALVPTGHSAAADPSRTTFNESVKAVGTSHSATGHAAWISRSVLTASETAASMSFEVALRMRHFDEMQARIARGERISDAEKEARYFPLAVDHDRVVAWLRAQGFEVTRTDTDRLAVFARGSVDAVGRAFQVSFARVIASDGGEFTSAITAPSLPADVSPAVLGVHGLQPHIRRHPLSTPRSPGTITLGNGYLPAQIATAYNAASLGTTGAGQTIAIYALGYPVNSDLTAFWTEASVSQTVSNVQTVNIAGGPGTSTDADILEEATLDVEWAGALAPGAAIRVYGANENDPASNDEILQQVYADSSSIPSMHVLSISVGGNELDVPRNYLVIEAQYMANLASAGISVLVASGDAGAVEEGKVQTTYPTSDPDVTGVGGTSLALNATNGISSEVAWSDSGGGISVEFTRPPWQTGTGVPAGTMRLVPDVASAADPGLGAVYYFSGKNVVIGGTSWSAPTWEAFCALINQKLGSSGPLGLLNPKLYPLNGTNAFNDITSGSNGAYSAGVGYDLVTGLGSPNVAAIAAAPLTASPAAKVPAQTGSQVVTVGQLATFFVVGYGEPLPTYAWQKMPSGSTGWSALSDGGDYSGTQTPMMVVSGTSAAMTGDQFECIVTNGSGTSTSTPVGLTVNNVGVTTLAGWPGSSGHTDGTGRAARFALAGGVRTDPSGNAYVSDSSNYTIRKVTPRGVVTTVAGVAGTSGSRDGPASTALFAGVGGVAVDSAGNLFVADSGNYTIREISTSGNVTTIAGLAGTRGEVDGTGSTARLYDPQNLAIDRSNNIYVADGMGNVIRKVTEAGVVTTLAGSGTAGPSNGTGIGAQFNDPTGIAVDYFGNIYVADFGNDTVREVTPSGVVTTLAGSPGTAGSADGSGEAASFNGAAGLGVDSSGNVYVADAANDTIRKVAPGGFVTTVAGLAGDLENIDGLATNARFNTPGDVTIDASGIVYVADSGNSTIRRIIPGLDSPPFFEDQPASQTAALGSSVTFSAGIAGTAPFTYQWDFNGAPLAGATTAFYTISSVQQASVGSYTLTLSNAEGSATSSAATLTVGTTVSAPGISTEPVGGVLTGGSLTLTVTASGTGPFSYQWLLNGSAISGATGSTYTATATGSYTVAVTNASGTTLSAAAVVGASSRLSNISSRAFVDTGPDITIAGFAITGPAGSTKQVLIRGVGPTLTNFSISDFLTAPTLTLFNSSGAVLATNSGWGALSNAAQIVTLSSQVGAFSLIANSNDCVILTSLPPGNYTAQLSGVNASTGVGLVEAYETSTSDPARLVNISTRAQVGTGSNILIAGFVVYGAAPATVLIRAVGPTLSTFNVSGVLANPVLTVFNSSNAQIATNTGWENQANSSEIATVGAAVGAFALPAGSADSALVLTLSPGTYTAQVSGANGTAGIALVEVYQSQ